MPYILNQQIPHIYLDSVLLMQVSLEVESQEGVLRAMALTATPSNLDLLAEFGLLTLRREDFRRDGILLAVEAVSEEAAQQACAAAWKHLQPQGWAADSVPRPVGPNQPADLPSFLSWREAPEDARVAVISVPGAFAAAEALKALKAGRHVVLFSNQVSVEAEVRLKQAAAQRNLLMLGPECGTAILGGVPLGFANQVRPGNIGLVAASGSGLQEVTCLIDRWGGGITQAIGTGSRDLSDQVGGLAMHAGLDLLAQDQNTHVVVLLSKPASPRIVETILARAKTVGKPVVCFLGLPGQPEPSENLTLTRTLAETARCAVRLVGLPDPPVEEEPHLPQPNWIGRPVFLRGLYSGGTLAYEAMLLAKQHLGPIYSNVPLDAAYQIGKRQVPPGNSILDLGTEEFTSGIPHPMIDGRLRSEMIAEAGAEPHSGVILLDIILGLGSNPDPVGSLAAGIRRARAAADAENRDLFIVASVTGTRADLQGYERQVQQLTALGVHVFECNAAAACFAINIIQGHQATLH